mmetsp:Transcript_23396/g.55451  ORF Transcript_23396/g.55451 Transcript_23396/m.55451 type:complete len:99 (-) Transcript_23396:368-664(-)
MVDSERSSPALASSSRRAGPTTQGWYFHTADDAPGKVADLCHIAHSMPLTNPTEARSHRRRVATYPPVRGHAQSCAAGRSARDPRRKLTWRADARRRS